MPYPHVYTNLSLQNDANHSKVVTEFVTEIPQQINAELPYFDLSVNIGSATFKNPVTVASGTFGSGKEYSDFVNLESLGAVTTKGVSLNPWEGNPGVRVYETAGGMLNSIGLQNPGVEAFCESDLSWLTENYPNTSVIVNVSEHSAEEYASVIHRLESESSIDAYEINISCPNVDAGGLAFGVDPIAAAKVTKICRHATHLPIIMKLSPNVTDISEIARACEDAGADGLSLINTVMGTAIDINKRKMVFARRVAGLSGPAVKPIALRMVYLVAQAVNIPLIGMGGISCANDAIEFMLAGATMVSVGTANFVNPQVTLECMQGIKEYCKEHGFTRARDLVGALED